VILCGLTTCYYSEGACFQRLKLKCDELRSSFAFKFKLRRYTLDAKLAAAAEETTEKVENLSRRDDVLSQLVAGEAGL